MSNKLLVPKELFQRFSGDILWHFTGSNNKEAKKAFEILQKILYESTLKSNSVDETLIFHSTKQLYLGGRVTCLADIPLKDLLIHILRYGSFGIGFNKKKAVIHGYNPVFYIDQKSRDLHNALNLIEDIRDFLESKSPELSGKYEKLMEFLGSYVKPGSLDEPLVIDNNIDRLQINNFYYEREWRFIGDWKFSNNDIEAILVDDVYIDEFFDFLKLKSIQLSKKTLIIPRSFIAKS